MAGNTTDRVTDKIKDAIPEDLHGDVEALKKDFTRLSGDVQTLMKDTARLGKRSGQHAVDAAWKQGEQLADKVRTGTTYAEECMTEHPLATLGVAVGVGLLAGMILRR